MSATVTVQRSPPTVAVHIEFREVIVPTDASAMTADGRNTKAAARVNQGLITSVTKASTAKIKAGGISVQSQIKNAAIQRAMITNSQNLALRQTRCRKTWAWRDRRRRDGQACVNSKS
jgi:hypothetical protein